MSRTIIDTGNAPAAIGSYSQAVRVGDTVFLSGQIPLDPDTGAMCQPDAETAVRRVFANLQAVAAAAGGELADIVRLTVYLVDLADFAAVNAVMAEYFRPPFPARAAVGVAALPKDARVEIDAIMVLGSAP